jgi:hypothetical protein
LFFSAPACFAQDDLSLLTRKIIEGQDSERGKVSAIFHWITDNISYKIKNRNAIIGAASKRNSIMPDGDDSPLLPLNERVALKVLGSGVAVCDGYARLFSTLCDYAGIRSEIIVGYARSSNNKPVARFGVNHYWNAVQIDGKWFLADATWASGYLTPRGDEFIREFDENYFLASPEQFIKDHYPDDLRWTLLDDSKIPDEFFRSPFKQKSFSKYQITGYAPTGGIIEAQIGDTLHFKLETALNEKERPISPDQLIDSAIFTYSASWVFLQPDKKNSPGSRQKHYSYPVQSSNAEWLYLMYNDDLVLRYKLNIKKKNR